ncbi:MAG: hypothetical protein OJF51_001822 [Nitrospira sp.]|jgi:hypothetical protein|nr:MAG: hypothetical protein OJF51_001822 [Nitrospira sp.]
MPLDMNIDKMLLSISMGAVLVVMFPSWSIAQEATEPKSIRMTCGMCPDGYATTGVTQSSEICKDGDSTLVQCVPLGANMLGVCGSCPDGYAEIGSSSVPARCGSKDGGRLTQCQLRKMEQNFPDSTQGYKRCPPDCGRTALPGQGTLPPPPKYQQMPEGK